MEIIFCSVENCQSASRTRGLCPKHYNQQMYGAPERTRDGSETPKCAVSHCVRLANSRTEGSLCQAHYHIKWRGGDPESRILRAKDDAKGRTDKKCRVGDCHRRAETKSLCNYHARQARTGRIEVPAELGIKLNGPCSFEGCERPYTSKRLCHSHYMQWTSTGKLTELRDYGKYVKGDHVCAVGQCKKPAVSQGLCERHNAMRVNYKLTVEQITEVWENPVCSNPGCGETKRLHMDHDHATGAFRALLCSGCNTGLGMLKEDAARIRGLADYIESFG